MKSRILAVLVGMLLTALPAMLLAQPQGPEGMGGPMKMHQRLMEQLKLTDQQKKDIDKIHSDAMKEQIDRRAQIQKAQVELRDLLKADNPSQGAIEKKIGEISQLREQAASKRLSNWFAINKLLTPEQQKIWKRTLQMHAEMIGRMGMRGGRGMQRGMRMGMRDKRMNERGMDRPMRQAAPEAR